MSVVWERRGWNAPGVSFAAAREYGAATDAAGTDAASTDAAGTAAAAGTDAAGTDATGTDATGTDAAGTHAAGACRAGEVAELYALHARRLERIVRVDVRAPQPVIEDACQFAWTRLLFHADRIRRDTAIAWLTRTAVRHAFKLVGRECRELSLDRVLEEESGPPDCLLAPAPDEIVEQRQRLAELRSLPERQQRLVWLHGLGLNYVEMAAREGCTVRTVERQLLRAKRKVRTVAPV
jgi:RNA polymerase sigma factor (sigma-70 family)